MRITMHAYIAVTDLDLSLRRRLDADWAELEGATTPIFLLVRDQPAPRHENWTVHLDFLTDDLEAATSQAHEAGAALLRDFQEHVWGRMANMVDPFNNPFDLIELASGGYQNFSI